MGYSRTHVREALLTARRDNKPVEALKVGDRETEIQLERMGYLPIDQDAVDKRIQDWYVSQGLVLRSDAPADAPINAPDDTPGDAPEMSSSSTSSAALEAAEAALVAASAALRLARAMAS